MITSPWIGFSNKQECPQSQNSRNLYNCASNLIGWNWAWICAIEYAHPLTGFCKHFLGHAYWIWNNRRSFILCFSPKIGQDRDQNVNLTVKTEGVNFECRTHFKTGNDVITKITHRDGQWSKLHYRVFFPFSLQHKNWLRYDTKCKFNLWPPGDLENKVTKYR